MEYDLSICHLIKKKPTLKILAYGAYADSMDDYLRII